MNYSPFIRLLVLFLMWLNINKLIRFQCFVFCVIVIEVILNGIVTITVKWWLQPRYDSADYSWLWAEDGDDGGVIFISDAYIQQQQLRWWGDITVAGS